MVLHPRRIQIHCPRSETGGRGVAQGRRQHSGCILGSASCNGGACLPGSDRGHVARARGLIRNELVDGGSWHWGLLGPLFASHWTGQREASLRIGVLFGFIFGGIGYLLLGSARSLWFAFAVIVLAHSGTSTVWVFSTTLLHLNTEDRFLGRTFGADLAISMFVLAAATWIAGQAIDAGISPRAVAVGTGAAMFLPAAMWALALRLWRSG